MNLQLLRNATQILQVNGKNILIDPMLAPKHFYPPFERTGTEVRIPTVNLPINAEELELLIAKTDAVLLTHLHLDHWDELAKELLPKDMTLFCQPADAETIHQAGFTNVQVIEESLIWNGIGFNRTGGQHGVGEIGKMMGIVSGYVIRHEQEMVYIAGDTIWCEEVKLALDQYQPDRIVLNGGAARFVVGEPIVMDIKDILKVAAYIPASKIYVVHLESVSHASESRAFIKGALAEQGLSGRCFVPEDGAFLF
jgi:L-ascorbate metabolism protein UlaG (beta-lactamase superfamily)